MRETLSILLMLVLVVTIFAGCGGDKKGDDAAALKDGFILQRKQILMRRVVGKIM